MKKTARNALIAADLHISAAHPRRTEAFATFLNNAVTHSNDVYLLGDVFDAWPGDDCDDDTAKTVIDAILTATQQNVAVHVMTGNRDFLLGRRFCKRSGCRLLSEQHVAIFGERRFLFAHGDEFCGDAMYLFYRGIVRSAGFATLARILPISQRLKTATLMRRQSQKHRQTAIINPTKAAAALRKQQCEILIHGHTHAAGEETWQDGGREFVRYCLPDWEQTPGAHLIITAAGEIQTAT